VAELRRYVKTHSYHKMLYPHWPITIRWPITVWFTLISSLLSQLKFIYASLQVSAIIVLTVSVKLNNYFSNIFSFVPKMCISRVSYFVLALCNNLAGIIYTLQFCPLPLICMFSSNHCFACLYLIFCHSIQYFPIPIYVPATISVSPTTEILSSYCSLTPLCWLFEIESLRIKLLCCLFTYQQFLPNF